MHARDVGLVFGGSGSGKAQKVAVVGKHERGHHSVQVYDAEHIARSLGEEDVVHLGIAVADALGQLPAAAQFLAERHLIPYGVDAVEQFFRLLQALAVGALGAGLVELSEAALHVVEIGDSIVQVLRDISQLSLKLAKAFAYDIGALGRYYILRDTVGDVVHKAPILSLGLYPQFAGASIWQEMERHDTLFPEVARHGIDVEHQACDVGKHMVIYLLEYMCALALGGNYDECRIYKTVAQLLYLSDLRARDEAARDVEKLFIV